MDQRDRNSLLRILDVNVNRAAEALRTAEEVCRFHWNVQGFAADLKSLRHEVLAALTPTLARRSEFLAARDIEGDVGRENASPATVTSPAELAVRSIERAKEALRCLEEASRALTGSPAARIERARYRLYAIEKGLERLISPHGLTDPRRQAIASASLCLLATSSLCRRNLEATVADAVQAGAGVVQLREKDLEGKELLRRARALRELTARRGALFIVNDRPDIALLAEADGVHCGQGDLSVSDARSVVGPGRLVGVSTHSVEQARSAERDGADYIGVGPMFPTDTKNAGAILGPAGLREVLDVVSLPAFAIGGIDAQRAALIRSVGGSRVAVSSSVLSAPDPATAVRDILEAITEPI